MVIDKPALRSAVLQHLENQKIGQSKLAKNVGVCQAVVSRAINGHWVRYRGAIKQLGDYLRVSNQPFDPRESAQIMQALEGLWDGSEEGEAAIAALLVSVKSLGVCCVMASKSDSDAYRDK